MKALLLGVGMQGKAALHDLANSGIVSHVIAADRDLDMLKAHVKSMKYENVTCERVDATEPESVERLMGNGVKVVLDLLPVQYIGLVARTALKHRVHLVNTFYVVPELQELASDAESKGITILPEFGLDPGIDLVMMGEGIRRLDTVERMFGYGGGIPEPEAADNAIKYKISWTFDGVLKSYRRASRIIRDGEVVEISDTEQFELGNVHLIDVEGLGTLEACPNGDALKYRQFLGDTSALTHLGRYSCRWPGHAAFWKKLVDLHLLDEAPVMVDGLAVSPRRFLACLLEPQLQYKDGERDVAMLRVEVLGRRNGRAEKLIFQMVDRKDLETGLTAMSRTVGFTASIGAQMILDGSIDRRGLASPVQDVPWDVFKEQLQRRGIGVSLKAEPWNPEDSSIPR